MAKTKTAAKPRRSSKTTTKASTASKSKKTTAKSTKKKVAAKKTPAKRKKTKSVADEEVTVSRRRKERRTEEKTEASAEKVTKKQPKLERREKVNRRRQIDPTTCERDYSDHEVEFMNALDQYKRTSGRMFPTCSEILEVIRGIGYVKLNPAELAARKALEAPVDDIESELEAEANEILEESLADQEEDADLI